MYIHPWIGGLVADADETRTFLAVPPLWKELRGGHKSTFIETAPRSLSGLWDAGNWFCKEAGGDCCFARILDRLPQTLSHSTIDLSLFANEVGS
jgi:hypothetical protein